MTSDGETVTLRLRNDGRRALAIELAPRAFEIWTESGWRRPPGTYLAHAGRSVADLRLRTMM